MAFSILLILRRPPFETPPRRLLRVNCGRLEGRNLRVQSRPERERP